MNTRGRARGAAGAGVSAVLLFALVAGFGESAAVPGLGPATALPPWDLAAHPPSGLVTVLLVAAHLLGAAAVWSGLRVLRDGGRLPVRAAAVAGVAAVALLTAVPPLGSADHLSYVAYGRIAAAGDDAYAVPPGDWRGGTDPVAGAVQPPWERTPSVYGPVATAVLGAVAEVGGGSLRRTVWAWQLLCGAAYLLVGALLAAAARPGPARSRVLLLWTLNPLLLGQLVLGAHLDVLAAAAAVAGVLLAARVPLLSGAMLGAAAGMKAPYALAGLAALWVLRDLPWRDRVLRAGAGAVGGLAVLAPAYLWAGPHVLDQLGRASRMTSMATPWRALANLIDLGFGTGAGRAVAVPVSFVLATGLVFLLRPGVGAVPPGVPGRTGEAVRWYLLLAFAWVASAPYALPWYDAMVWAPLALAGASWLDAAVLARLTVLGLAYVPGRVVGMSPVVEQVTLGGRRYVAPVLVLAVLLAVLRRAVRDRREARGSGPGRGRPGEPDGPGDQGDPGAPGDLADLSGRPFNGSGVSPRGGPPVPPPPPGRRPPAPAP
ncbi:MAG: polyprenol phosphomannose-dependent alpha 1,6 mannosyltransferase MptB [Kineosporiaceae bacterium]